MWAQAPATDAAARPQQQPDVLVFINGDTLSGQLERSTGSSVLFKTDMAGEITVDWSKVKELRTNRQFAVIPKNVDIRRGEDPDKIPQGRLTVADQKLEIKASNGNLLRAIPAADSAYVIDQKTFDTAVLNPPSIFRTWTGAVTLGTSLVEATQKSNNLSGGANLLRLSPSETWLDRRDRTALNFNFAYGTLTQPNTPDIKTDIYHLDAERDEYFTSRLFGFGQIAYDHNFSQGLDLEQSYGGGIGWTLIKNSIEELNLKASLNYLKQQFQNSAQNQNLIGSVFAETYNRRFVRKVEITEQGSITPAWNNTNAYSAAGQIGMAFPLYKRFSLSLTSLDTFINNPPVGFRKNSFQFTTGLTYALK